jgi:uncharacterized membrane protein required for colicin V production
MLIDIALIVLAIISIAVGYNRGLLSSIFALIGYLGGGLAGFALAFRYTQSWEGLLSIVSLHLFAVFTGASVGTWLLKKIGSGIHKRALFAPLKFIDSLLGALLSLAQSAILAYIVITLFDYLPWALPEQLINGSELYIQIRDFNLLSFQISDLLQSASSRWDQLKL